MTDLTAAFGANHGIGGSAISNGMDDLTSIFMSGRLGMGSLYEDLSGSMPFVGRTPKPLDPSAYQSGEILTKFREFRTLVGDRKSTLKSLEETLAEIRKWAIGEESMTVKLDTFHHLLLDDGRTSQEQFEALQRARKVYFEAQKPVADGRIERLQEEITKVRQELDFAETNLGALRAFLTAGVRELIPEERIHNNLCPVCMEHDVNCVLVPCGHTLCRGCSDQVGTKCMTCRAAITKVNPVFFSI